MDTNERKMEMKPIEKTGYMGLDTQSPTETWMQKFVEEGANIEHDRWARWQKHMFSKMRVNVDNSMTLPEEFCDRWFRQIDTKYEDLSEEEKESDRKETYNYLPLIRTIVLEAKSEAYTQGRIDEAKTCTGCKEGRDAVKKEAFEECLREIGKKIMLAPTREEVNALSDLSEKIKNLAK